MARDDRREIWLATSCGPLLHRPVLDGVEAPVALCSTAAGPVDLGWFTAAPSPFAPLTFPRPLAGSWPAAVRVWAPVAAAFDELHCLPSGDGAALRIWLSVWLAYRDGQVPPLALERYSSLRESLPQPAADSLAIAGVSGISGLCSTCRRR